MTNDTQQMEVTSQPWAGPQTHEEAKCFHQGFISGLTVYARESGHSTLRTVNELLRRLMDDQGFKTIETYELLGRDAKTARERELEDLLVSARAIAQRKGADTAWERFDERLASFGIGCITAKVFKVLPSDRELLESMEAVADECGSVSAGVREPE